MLGCGPGALPGDASMFGIETTTQRDRMVDGRMIAAERMRHTVDDDLRRVNLAVAAQYGLDSLYRADVSLFLLIFSMAAALGVVSGVLPARKAASVDPVEVLREV